MQYEAIPRSNEGAAEVMPRSNEGAAEVVPRSNEGAAEVVPSSFTEPASNSSNSKGQSEKYCKSYKVVGGVTICVAIILSAPMLLTLKMINSEKQVENTENKDISPSLPEKNYSNLRYWSPSKIHGKNSPFWKNRLKIIQPTKRINRLKFRLKNRLKIQRKPARKLTRRLILLEWIGQVATASSIRWI